MSEKRRRILVLGDSLTFGRNDKGIQLELSWPAIVEARGCSVWHRGFGSARMEDVVCHAAELIRYYASGRRASRRPFDACIVQVGIVDCTPRLLSRRLTQGLEMIPGGRFCSTRLKRNKKMVGRFGRPWTTSKDFECGAQKLCVLLNRLAPHSAFIEIARPCFNLSKNVGDYSEAVRLYNRILRNIKPAGFIKAFDGKIPTDSMLADGHHLNKHGHRTVAGQVMQFLASKNIPFKNI